MSLSTHQETREKHSLTPYRTSTPPVVYKEPKPINWGPAKRTGLLGLVITPITAITIVAGILGGGVAAVCVPLITILVYILPSLIILDLSDQYKHDTAMAKTVRIAWWPITVIVFLVGLKPWRLPKFAVKRLVHYISTGK